MAYRDRERVPRIYFNPRPRTIVTQGGKEKAVGSFRFKVDGIEKWADIIEGTLVSIEHKLGTYEGKPANQYLFTIRDEQGDCIIQAGDSSQFSQGLISRLASLPTIDHVIVSAFCTFDANDKPFIHAMLSVIDENGEEQRVPQKYKSKKGDKDSEDQQYYPPTEPVEVSPGNVVYIKTERLKFMADVVEVIRTRLTSDPKNWSSSDLRNQTQMNDVQETPAQIAFSQAAPEEPDFNDEEIPF